jgi:hypothetical protein
MIDPRDAVNPSEEARLPPPCGRRPRIELAGAAQRAETLARCERPMTQRKPSRAVAVAPDHRNALLVHRA